MLSIRAKLTLWYLGIAATVLIAFAVAIYIYLSRALVSAIDQSLWSQADHMARMIANPSRSDEPGRSVGFLLQPQYVTILNSDVEITDQILDSEGHEVPIIPARIDRARMTWEPQFDEVYITPEKRARVITWPARDEEGETFFVIVGQTLDGLKQAQWQFLILFAVSNSIALALAGLGGLWIANNALQPVDRITSAAERIGRGNLSERVEEPRTRDEVGHLAATFNEMIGKLEQAFERERQFTADASHELKTPLAVLRGDMEVTLRRDRSVEDYKRVLESSIEEVDRLTRLVDDLLTLARSDAGERMLEPGPVRIDELAAEVHTYINPLAKSAGVALDYIPPGAPVIIEGDQKRLKQLLVNLLDNAIKYTPSGGSVRLALNVEDTSALIEVADTGRGIPAETLPHIFDRFFRQSDPLDARVNGFGLGLAISKLIVDAHGGSIEASSPEGQGSRFTVRLPLWKDEESGVRSPRSEVGI
jgi:heavy metal sensor kinase